MSNDQREKVIDALLHLVLRISENGSEAELAILPHLVGVLLKA